MADDDCLSDTGHRMDNLGCPTLLVVAMHETLEASDFLHLYDING